MREIRYIALLLIALLLSGCAANQASEQEGQPLSKMLDGPLDTVSTVTLYGWSGGEKPIDDIFAMLNDIDERMSAVSENSEISAISSSNSTACKVSEDTFNLIEYAKNIGAETDGAFDITIRPVMNLWGIGTENAQVPERTELDDALSAVGYEDVWLDRASSSVTLSKQGMMLDLGGIAKGYACDSAVEILKNANAASAIVDMGGNIYALGSKTDGSPWRVGIKSPLVGENSYFGVVSVTNRAVVTSGVYERFFEINGKLYHHIIDPKTGYPVDNGLISVTIISESATQADALSTACFVLGAARGLEYLNTLSGMEGIFVSDDMSVRTTAGLKDNFKITDERFKPVA